LNNANGITFGTSGAVLLNALGWDSSNSGTYETFTGEFQLDRATKWIHECTGTPT
jgi:hypothetical protein